MRTQYRITTIDNPYCPWTQFKQWYAYDLQQGYNTLGWLDVVTFCYEGMSDDDYEIEIEKGINELLRIDVYGKFLKIKKPES